MSGRQTLTSAQIAEFQDICGAANVRTAPADLLSFGADWTKGFQPAPSLVVLPASTAEVAKTLAYCHEQRIKVVPSGGRTGLAGGAIADAGEVVIALDRMSKILNLDAVGKTMTVEAGVKTQQVQQAAAEIGLFFGLDLASKGSSQIGGNISTNAGGTKLIRYGGMREQVLGIEVVLANGHVLDMNSRLYKNNSGYDLKYLFIGAEGTLGIVTKATLRLMSRPKELQLCVFGVKQFSDIPLILKEANLAGISLTAFEFFTDQALNLVLRFHTQLRNPFTDRHPFYVLIEAEKPPTGAPEIFEPLCEALFEKELAVDAVIAANSQQSRDFWGLRENISESISQYGWVRKNDISLPIDKLDEFVSEINRIVTAFKGDIEMILFGHIGDGNLHINYVAPKTLDQKTFKAQAEEVERSIFALLPRYHGSISAEHGIGLVKKKDLHLTRSSEEISYMKAIKNMFDPHGILNPGKIFDI